MPFDKDGKNVPDAQMCAKFLRAHSEYLMTGKTSWPYINSARATSEINTAAPGCERTTYRCPNCKCLHVWTERVPNKCSSCGVNFNWPGLRLVSPATASQK